MVIYSPTHPPPYTFAAANSSRRCSYLDFKAKSIKYKGLYFDNTAIKSILGKWISERGMVTGGVACAFLHSLSDRRCLRENRASHLRACRGHHSQWQWGKPLLLPLSMEGKGSPKVLPAAFSINSALDDSERGMDRLRDETL